MQRLFGVPGLERVHRLPRRIVGDEHGNAGDDGKGAALAAEHPGFDPFVVTDERVVLDEGQSGTAKGTAENIEQVRVHDQDGCA